MRLRHKMALSALMLSLGLAVFFVAPQEVFAAAPLASESLNDRGPTNNSGRFNDGGRITPYFTVGRGQYNYPDTQVSVYVPYTFGSFTVTIENAGAGCETAGGGGVVGPDFGGAITQFKLVDPVSGALINGQNKSGGSGCGSITLTADASQGNLLFRQNQLTNYNYFSINAHMSSISGGVQENAFRINAPGGILVGLDHFDFSGYGYRDQNLNNGNTWDESIVFGTEPAACIPPGGLPDYPGSVNWRDSDVERTDWNDNMIYSLWTQPRSASPTDVNAWQLISSKRQQAGQISQDGSFGQMGFSQNRRYMLTLENIGVRNTVRVQITDGLSQFGAKQGNIAPCQSQPQPPNAACVSGGVISLQAGGSGNTTVTMSNNGGPNAPSWTAAYNLVRTGSIPGGADGSVTGGNPPNPPVDPGQSRTFAVNVSLPANVGSNTVYTVNFQMRDASGNNFGARCGVTINVEQPRPNCYIRFSVNGQDQGTNASITVPYGTGVTIKAQILNPGPSTWGPRYYMTESINGNPRQNIGNLTSVGPGAFTGVFTRSFPSVQGQTTWNYQVWVTPPGGASGPASVDCPITAYVTYPIVQGSIGGSLGADCKRVGYEVHWVPASGNPIRTIIRATYNGGQTDRDVTESPGNHSFDPFTGPFAAVPIDQRINYELFGLNGDGTFSSLGSVAIGPCLTHICSDAPNIDVEPNETTSISHLGGFIINNSTNRNDSFSINTSVTGASVAYPNPYNFTASASTNLSYVVPASSITATTSVITINRALVYRGAVIEQCQPQQAIPKSRPYLKVFGGDVSAGGWFNNGNDSCSSSTNVQQGDKGGIRTFASPNVASHPYRSGSSSEFAAFALGLIDNQTASKRGFYSWSQGSAVRPMASIVPFDTLEFANTPQDGQFGFTADSGCIKDYYSNQLTSGATGISGNLNSIPAGGGANTSRIFNHGTSSFSINGPWQFQQNERLTIYVSGDVYINTDITYSNSVLRPSYFSLIAKGNIYIGSNVRRLDGLYIAQPDFGSTSGKGNIWTCAVPGPGPAGTLKAPTPGEIVTACTGNGKLTINGAVIAKHVTFNRVGNLTGNTLSAVRHPSQDPEVAGNNKSVEEINYIPDMVTGSPFLSTEGSNSRLDAVTILPPVF